MSWASIVTGVVAGFRECGDDLRNFVGTSTGLTCIVTAETQEEIIGQSSGILRETSIHSSTAGFRTFRPIIEIALTALYISPFVVLAIVLQEEMNESGRRLAIPNAIQKFMDAKDATQIHGLKEKVRALAESLSQRFTDIYQCKAHTHAQIGAALDEIQRPLDEARRQERQTRNAENARLHAQAEAEAEREEAVNATIAEQNLVKADLDAQRKTGQAEGAQREYQQLYKKLQATNTAEALRKLGAYAMLEIMKQHQLTRRMDSEALLKKAEEKTAQTKINLMQREAEKEANGEWDCERDATDALQRLGNIENELQNAYGMLEQAEDMGAQDRETTILAARVTLQQQAHKLKELFGNTLDSSDKSFILATPDASSSTNR